MPVVVIAPKQGHYDKIVSNIQEIKSRSGKIIAVVTKGDTQVRELADYVIETPETQITIDYDNSITTIVVSYCCMRGCKTNLVI
jgi:glucosamine--fructose-6-phosphate aminotransferase (isomerizing)